MNSYILKDNSIYFNHLGVMFCTELSYSCQHKYLIIPNIEYINSDVIDNICSQIDDLYSRNIIDSENLILHIDYNVNIGFRNFIKVFKVLNKHGYKYINFVIKNLNDAKFIENMVKHQKAIVCLKLDYGTSLDNISLKKLKIYLNNTNDKKNIIVHYVINNIKNVDFSYVQEFIKSMYRIGINTIGLRIEHKYLDYNIYNLQAKNLKNIFIEFYKLAKKYSFYIDTEDKLQNNYLKELFKAKFKIR